MKEFKPTPDQLTALNTVLQSCAVTEGLCNDCKACGIDVDPEHRENTQQATTAAKLKARFFPNAV